MKKTGEKPNIRKPVMAALFAALCCVATFIVRIPSVTGGYVNPGECFVLLGGFMLGAGYGSLAASVGCMLADIFSGCAYYAPATFIIKGACVLCCCAVYKPLSKALPGKKVLCRVLSAVCGEMIMIVGYFLYSSFIYGSGVAAALSSVPGNVVQATLGIVVSVLLCEVFDRTGVSRFINKY